MIRIGFALPAALVLLSTSIPGWGQAPAASKQLNPLRLSPHHVTASVADLEKEASWYERVLGFERSKLLGNPQDFSMYQMTMPGYRIDLVSQKGSTRQHGKTGAFEQGWLHVVFKTPDINTAYKWLVAQGTDVVAHRDQNDAITRVTFHDPEGNELEIVAQ